MNYKKMWSGRLICSFIFLFSLFSVNLTNAQETPNQPTIQIPTLGSISVNQNQTVKETTISSNTSTSTIAPIVSEDVLSKNQNNTNSISNLNQTNENASSSIETPNQPTIQIPTFDSISVNQNQTVKETTISSNTSTSTIAPVASEANLSKNQNNTNLISNLNQTNENASSSIGITLSDVDGDSLNDVTYENNKIKLVISSKTGSISFYYLKGLNFNENLFPPHIIDLGYTFEENSMKVFDINTPSNTFSGTNYKIEIESQTENEVVVRATPNLSHEVNDNTPDINSVSLVRRFIFSNDSYSFKIENKISNLKEKLISLGNDTEGSFKLTYGPGIFMEPYGPTSLIALKTGGESELFTKVDSLNDKGSKAGSYCGVGLKDQYFCVIMETDQPISISAVGSQTRSVNEQKRPMDTRVISCIFPKFNLGAKETRNFDFQVYAGPVVLEELQKINRAKVANLGWLNTLMLNTLRFFYSLIPNYGIAIILLTLLVRIVLYPLTLKQSKEMVKMQKIQPKLKDIQVKYKDDPQKMNEEVMKLYQKNHVNPLGGCFPLILQLPIIMALFETIRGAVELRKASFLWLTDLSKGDPYLILPIAIAALMYYQQNSATANVDPQQRQAMAFMPMMMLFITFSLPSGLLVYWFASSVLGILQQLQANRMAASMKEEK